MRRGCFARRRGCRACSGRRRDCRRSAKDWWRCWGSTRREEEEAVQGAPRRQKSVAKWENQNSAHLTQYQLLVSGKLGLGFSVLQLIFARWCNLLFTLLTTIKLERDLAQDMEANYKLIKELSSNWKNLKIDHSGRFPQRWSNAFLRANLYFRKKCRTLWSA